jgi:hypothetical protein
MQPIQFPDNHSPKPLRCQEKSFTSSLFCSKPLRCYSEEMAKSLLSKYLSELGRRGGKARLKTMTAEQRRAIATKASKAAAKARTRKAKERKAKKRESA